MSNPQLIKYIQDALANNISIEQIKENLLVAGWKEDDIMPTLQAMTFVKGIDNPNIAKPQGQLKEEIETKITGKYLPLSE